MCKFASFVLTKDRVFWSDATDSHEDLIRNNNLHADGAYGPNVLRVEITPKEWGRVRSWEYRVDQDKLPEWHNPKTDEARARKALTERLTQPYWKRVRKFIAEIPKTAFLKPDGKPDPEWKLFVSDSWNAAWNAAGNAAGNAAWNAAGDAARHAAWNAAWNAARHAAGNAAGNAAWNAAWNAAGDASLYARILCCIDLPIDPKHVTHAEARWRAWQKGYAVLCDVNGVLYVYAKETM